MALWRISGPISKDFRHLTELLMTRRHKKTVCWHSLVSKYFEGTHDGELVTFLKTMLSYSTEMRTSKKLLQRPLFSSFVCHFAQRRYRKKIAISPPQAERKITSMWWAHEHDTWTTKCGQKIKFGFMRTTFIQSWKTPNISWYLQDSDTEVKPMKFFANLKGISSVWFCREVRGQLHCCVVPLLGGIQCLVQGHLNRVDTCQQEALNSGRPLEGQCLQLTTPRFQSLGGELRLSSFDSTAEWTRGTPQSWLTFAQNLLRYRVTRGSAR